LDSKTNGRQKETKAAKALLVLLTAGLAKVTRKFVFVCRNYAELRF
jgi:hypothetical protein